MKSLLNKRLPGILALGLVALAVGAAGAPASASDAQVSGLTKSQKKAKSKAIKKCKKKNKKSAKKKKACIKKVNKKYKKLAKKTKGQTKTVDLGDNFYAPDSVNLKVNDSIVWSWANIGGFEPHNVTLDGGPGGVARSAFTSETTAAPSTKFTRTFTKPGKYDFVCTLHFAMTMTVQVSK